MFTKVLCNTVHRGGGLANDVINASKKDAIHGSVARPCAVAGPERVPLKEASATRRVAGIRVYRLLSQTSETQHEDAEAPAFVAIQTKSIKGGMGAHGALRVACRPSSWTRAARHADTGTQKYVTIRTEGM